MHLHGHRFRLRRTGPVILGPRRDTVSRVGERVTVDLDAANPGWWMLPLPQRLPPGRGMMTELAYER